jgi:hypothetical protein
MSMDQPGINSLCFNTKVENREFLLFYIFFEIYKNLKKLLIIYLFIL